MLHHFAPPTTENEIEAAALQYVRKVSGLSKPTAADAEAFAKAVAEVAASTKRLLAALPERGAVRTRDGEQKKAKARWALREAPRRAAKTA